MLMNEPVNMAMPLSQWVDRIPALALCLCLGCLADAGRAARSSSLDSPKYDAMKAEFLNVDPAYFSEVGQMRMTSYAIRTWLGTGEEVAKKKALLEEMRYPSPDSIYRTQAAWNQDKLNNPRLIRNTLDFEMALGKLAAQSEANK